METFGNDSGKAVGHSKEKICYIFLAQLWNGLFYSIFIQPLSFQLQVSK